MNAISLLIILFSLTGLLICVLSFLNKNKKYIPEMMGMTIAMVPGMVYGFMMGLISIRIFPDNLFLSTIIGMIVGLSIGFISGIFSSIMAILDGILSGTMGGTMGAMVGDMISHPYKETIFQVFFVITLITLLILVFMIQQILPSSKRKPIWFQNPILMASIIIMFFVIYSQSDSLYMIKTNKNEKRITEQNIVVDEYYFYPSVIKVQKGEEIKLKMQNKGMVKHHIEIVGLNKEAKISSAIHHHHTDESFRIYLTAGEQKEISFVPQKEGEYLIVCNIHGHIDARMKGVLVVY